MHKEILTENQQEALDLIKKYTKNFYLVGGTAIALHLGHRRSIDFDLFTEKDFDNKKIIQIIKKFYPIYQVIRDETGQLTMVINRVKFTFFQFPFKVEHQTTFDKIISLPDLTSLAAMKAYALGRRPKWKDYVDLYFILKDIQIDQIVKKAQKVFGTEFNEKLFRVQIGYFDDINYVEEVEFMPGFEVEDEKVKRTLTEISLS